MKKNGFFSVLIAAAAIAAVITLTGCNDKGWDPLPAPEVHNDATIGSLKIGGKNVDIKSKDGTSYGSADIDTSTLIQLRLKSAEVNESNAPTLSLAVTISPVFTQAVPPTVTYCINGSETEPGTFVNTKPARLNNKDVLWLKTKAAAGAEMFYRIKATIEYDANALSAEDFTIVFDPASRAYAEGAAVTPLSVGVSKAGFYDVQWYSNTFLTNTGGTAITEPVRSNGSSFTHSPGSLATANHYYYVVIKNETGTLISAPAVISISSSGVAVANVFQISSTKYNFVRGVGGTGSFMFREGSNADASPDADVTYINKLFEELGCNNLRIMVQDDYLNYIENKVQSRNQSIFYHDARANFFAVIRRVNELGGYVFAQPWTAPASMKTNNSISGSGGGANPGRLKVESYIEYANHLRDFLKWLNANNAPIFLLGILNEPDYGANAAYEGMGMSANESRNWFQLVGHFTTQQVSNPNTAQIGTAQYERDVIPGWGGGGPTHHVLTMSGDSAGDVVTYMNSQLSDRTGENNANDRQEVVGRHYYYSSGPRYIEFVGSGVAGDGGVSGTHGNPVTTWAERGTGTATTGSSARGIYNSFNPGNAYDVQAVLNYSPQMFPPDSTATNIKRELWQTEHDYNHGSSTDPTRTNAYTFWNAAFTAMNWIDYTFRVVGESLSSWWFSSSFSGYVTSNHTVGWPTPYYITPRGRAIAHYAKYVNETWLLGVERTEGTLPFNNGGSLNAGSTVPKITAFEDKDGKFISVVMFTPPHSPNGANGGAIGGGFGSGGTFGSDEPSKGSVNVGRLRLVLPEGYTAGSATAIRSWGHKDGEYWQNEPVFLSEDGKSAEVTLPGGNIISIRFMLQK